MTDTSHYKPNVSKLNNIVGANNNGGGLYEFEDGKDNGDRFYVLRSLSADRVDVDKEIKRMKLEGEIAKNEVIESAKKEVSEKLEKQIKKTQKTQKIKDTNVVDTNTTE